MLDVAWAPMLGAFSVLFEEFHEGALTVQALLSPAHPFACCCAEPALPLSQLACGNVILFRLAQIVQSATDKGRMRR